MSLENYKWTPEARQALEKSIEHWRRLAAGTQAEGEEPYSRHCHLCRMFSCANGHCLGCPVAAKTGHDHCEESPWGSAADAWEELARKKRMGLGKESSHKQFREAAKVMLSFLEGLRPAEPSFPVHTEGNAKEL